MSTLNIIDEGYETSIQNKLGKTPQFIINDDGKTINPDDLMVLSLEELTYIIRLSLKQKAMSA